MLHFKRDSRMHSHLKHPWWLLFGVNMAKHGQGKGKLGTAQKGGGERRRRLEKGQWEGKTHGPVLPCWYHNRNVYNNTTPCLFGENCMFSHTALSYDDFCNMIVPVCAASEGYTSDSMLSAASRARSARTRTPTSPYVKHGAALKKWRLCQRREL